MRGLLYVPLLIPVEYGWKYLVHVGACADEEEDDEQEGLEVEKSRLSQRYRLFVSKNVFNFHLLCYLGF